MNRRRPGDDTQRRPADSDSRAPASSQQRGRGGQTPRHLREHSDGRRPRRHAAALPREALAQLMDGALGHAVADHAWETGRTRFSDHRPPLGCPKATMPGSRAGREENDGPRRRESERGTDMSGMPNTCPALNVYCKSHEVDPTFIAEEAEAQTQ